MTPEEMYRKRSNGEIACAECRRLKLKCDRSVPCGTCVRRGCSSICPHLSLATGHSTTRIASTDTNQLQAKVTQMSERIRVLEEALERAHAQLEPGSTHSLLQQEFLSIKNVSPDQEEDTASEKKANIDVSLSGHGSLAITPDGAVHYFSRMAGTETFFMNAPVDSASGESQIMPSTSPEVADAFSFYPTKAPSMKEGLAMLMNSLPPREEAAALIEVHFGNVGLHYRPFDRRDMQDFVVDAIYDKLPSHGIVEVDSDIRLHPHLLGLIYALFAASALVDTSLPQNNLKAEQFHNFSKIALAMKPVLEDTTLWTVLALGFMAIYLHGTGRSRTQLQCSRYWSVTCLLAQSLGLHRDPAKWDLPPRIVELRRRVFWAINTLDHLQNLTGGYPAFFPAKRVDCELPIDEDETFGPDGKIRPGFPAWGFLAVRAFLAEMNSATTNATPPSYQTIMALDSKIREFYKPWQTPDPFEGLPPECPGTIRMYRVLPVLSRSFSLIYLHRAYFAQCCQDYPTRPTKSPHATSYITAFDSAMRVLILLKKESEYGLSVFSRMPYVWTHAFTAAIIVGSAIERGPNNAFASSGLIELAQAVGVFEKAAETLRRARIALPYLTTLLRNAHRSYTEYTSKGFVHPSPPSADGDDVVDLAVLGGQTRLFLPDRLDSNSQISRDCACESPPGPAAVLDAIQSVPVLRNPSSLDFGHVPRLIVGGAVQDAPNHPIGAVNPDANHSQFPVSYPTSSFPSTESDMVAVRKSCTVPYNGEPFSLGDNVELGAEWGMSNLMSFVDEGGVGVGGSEASAFPMFPTQQLPNDAVNLFGLDPTSTTTQADDSWTTFIRDIGLFYSPTVVE